MPLIDRAALPLDVADAEVGDHAHDHDVSNHAPVVIGGVEEKRQLSFFISTLQASQLSADEHRVQRGTRPLRTRRSPRW